MPQPESVFPEILKPADERTAHDKAVAALSIALIPVLTLWARTFAGREKVVDTDLIKIYASALAKLVKTVDELVAVRDQMILEKTYFPTPAEIAQHIKANRDTNPYEGWISALDGQGGTILCPREKAHGGYYRPDGTDNDGRGCAAMAEYADIREDLDKKRDALGVPVNDRGVRPLSTVTQKQFDEAGIPRRRALGTEAPALPARKPYMEREEVSPEDAERLIQEARDRAEARRKA